MTGEEMERAIQFFIEHHARMSSDIEALKETQERTAVNLESLAESVTRLESQAEVDRREMRERFELMSEEMRDGFNKFVLGNEGTRDLTNQVARLAIPISQRVTVLESKHD